MTPFPTDDEKSKGSNNRINPPFYLFSGSLTQQVIHLLAFLFHVLLCH